MPATTNTFGHFCLCHTAALCKIIQTAPAGWPFLLYLQGCTSSPRAGGAPLQHAIGRLLGGVGLWRRSGTLSRSTQRSTTDEALIAGHRVRGPLAMAKAKAWRGPKPGPGEGHSLGLARANAKNMCYFMLGGGSTGPAARARATVRRRAPFQEC